MEVLADRGTVRQGRDQPVGQVPRVRRHEPKARDRRAAVGRAQPVDGLDQLRQVGPPREVQPAAGPTGRIHVAESLVGRQVVAVRVDVLAKEGHLAVAGGGQRARLGDDVVERAAPFRAAAERHDAVRAGLVAAVDDRQPRRDRRRAGDRAAADGLRSGPGQVVGHADHGPADRGRRPGGPDRRLGRGQAQSIDQLRLLVRAEKHVHGRVAATKPGPMRLPHGTAGQDDPEPRIDRLQPRQLALPADHFLLGALADRAAVDHDELGRLEARGLFAAGRQEPPGHLLGVAPVHLAAQGPHVEARQPARLGQVFGEAIVDRQRRLARRRGGRRRELQHGQRAGEGRSFGHGCANEPTTPARWTPSATSGGTHDWACASAYVPVSPW